MDFIVFRLEPIYRYKTTMLPPAASPLLLRSCSLHSGWSPLQVAIRFRNSSSSGNSGFQPKRRPHKKYRPLRPPQSKRPIRDTAKGNDHRFIELDGSGTIDRATLESSFGPMGDAVIESVKNERQREMQHGMTYDDQVEEGLRMIDYYLSEEGSLEDRVGERRALAIDEPSSAAKREEYLADLDAMVKEETLKEMEVDTASMRLEDRIGAPEGTVRAEDEEDDNADDDPEVTLHRNQLAHGDWSEMLITVDRTIKLWRGGRLESYRALVIGGNLVR